MVVSSHGWLKTAVLPLLTHSQFTPPDATHLDSRRSERVASCGVDWPLLTLADCTRLKASGRYVQAAATPAPAAVRREAAAAAAAAASAARRWRRR